MANTVESQPTATVGPETMTTQERKQWLLTGDHPEPKTAESATAKKTSEPKSPVTESGVEERQQQQKTKPDQERNWRNLESERNQARERAEKAEARIKELEAKTNGAASPAAEIPKLPVVTETREPKPPEKPKRPDIAQFKTTAEFDVAMDKYDESMSTYSAQKRAYDDAKTQAEKTRTEIETFNKSVEEKWKAMVAKAEEKHADFKTVALDDKLARQIPMNSPVDEWVLQSDVGAEMLYYFGQHQDELKRILSLGRPAQHRELSKLEDELSGTSEKVTTAVVEEPPQEKVRKVTQAPPPPREVGGKGTATEDPIKDAVARRDFDSFRDRANERDIARRKRGR